MLLKDITAMIATGAKLFSRGCYLAVLALVFFGMPVHAADAVKVLAKSDSEVTIALPDGRFGEVSVEEFLEIESLARALCGL